MLIGRLFGIGNTKRAVVVAALLFVLGIMLAAGPARAAPCPACDDGGGGGSGGDPPTVNVNNASVTVNEGQTATNAGTYSDPDGNGTITLSASVGSVTKDASGDGTWSWSFRTTDGPDESQTVTITATDSAGATATTTFSLTVNNLSPVIYWQSFNSLQPPEGVARRYEFGVYDPGNDTFTVHGRECGNGVKDSQDPDNGTTAFHYVECRFPDGPGSTVVTATATDSDGASSSTGNLAVEITNVNPTAILNAPVSVDEGDTATISLTNQNDVQADKDAGFRYAFACDGGPLDGATYAASGTSASTNCALEDSETQTVRARIIDKDGGYSEYTREVAINNISPNGTIKINDGATATKSATVSLALSATDPLPGSGVGHMRFRNDNTETWSTWEPYATSSEWRLSDGDGEKTVHVQYRDNAGNVSTDEIQDGIQLDTTTPNTKITSGPSGTVKSTSASFGFSSSEADSKFKCSLDGATFTACASPKSYTTLKNGRHTFKVRAIDAAGNVDSTPASRAWTVDATRPTITSMRPVPGSITRDTTPSISATVRDNMTSLAKSNIKLYVNGKLISQTKYSYNRSTDRLVYNSPKLALGKKTVKIVATDTAKNAGVRSWYFKIR